MKTKTKRIFIVDDDEMITMMLSDYLSYHVNYSIQSFATGEECLENLELGPDIIVLDYNLNSVNPNASNGLEILKAIKKYDGSIMVIMYSSQEQYGIALQTIGRGALEYVIKDNDAFFKIDKIIKNL
jgi:DNA-binding NarL/FixJ family response regulator